MDNLVDFQTVRSEGKYKVVLVCQCLVLGQVSLVNITDLVNLANFGESAKEVVS